MNYEIELDVCADKIIRCAIGAGLQRGEYELTDADLEFLRGEQPDSLTCLPFADEGIQEAFEKDVQERVNDLLQMLPFFRLCKRLSKSAR